VRRFKQAVRSIAEPLALLLVQRGVSANAITVGAFFLNVLVGAAVAVGLLAPAGLLYLFFSPLDFLDGAVARLSGRAGAFGAFLDSLLDRASEAAVLLGTVYWYASQQQPKLAVLAAAALVGSFLVSYARARAEGLGYDCEVGWLQRPERIILLAAGLIASGLHPAALPIVLAVLALVTALTTFQRSVHVARQAGLAPARQGENDASTGRPA
jgi:CDP-diacylglycerol---glycerol-3-phosphate 3-phosphatidyltransferase